MRVPHYAALLMLAGCGDTVDPQPHQETSHTRIELLRGDGLARIGLTVDGIGGAVFLRGQRGSLFYGTGDTHVATIDTQRCEVTRYWRDQSEYLDAVKQSRLNLLHVELWNVWDDESPYPFLRDKEGRFRVEAAIRNGEWNSEYFAAVRGLVQGASERGIVVLFSLFNHYNVRNSDPRYGGKPWSAEPLRALNTDTGFGLDDYGTDVRRRTAEFFQYSNGAGELTPVGEVQKALIERLLEEIDEQNVVFELLMTPWLINNPHVNALDLASWENWVITTIRTKERALARATGVLVMVTPAALHSLEPRNGGRLNSDFEIRAWRQAYLQGNAAYDRWPDVAILDYTGFFAFDDPPFPQQSVAAMRERMGEHQAQYPEAVAFFNTDGFNRRYAPTTCSGRLDDYVSDVRHGWWEGLTGGVDLSRFPLEWAQRTYDLSRETQVGSLHFLNWTTAKSSMEDLSGGSW